MKRYFDIVGKSQTVMLEIIDDSETAQASAEEISKGMKMELKEITKAEYTRLTKKYTK